MTSQRGSLLIELLIGTGILAAGLFTVFLGLVTLTKTLERNVQLATATTVVSNQFATLRAQRVSSLNVGTTSTPTTDLPGGVVETLITSVSEVLKQVTVTVTWTSGTQTRSVTFVSNLATDGLESL